VLGLFLFSLRSYSHSLGQHLEADRGQKIGNDFAKAALRALKVIESGNSMPEEVQGSITGLLSIN